MLKATTKEYYRIRQKKNRTRREQADFLLINEALYIYSCWRGRGKHLLDQYDRYKVEKDLSESVFKNGLDNEYTDYLALYNTLLLQKERLDMNKQRFYCGYYSYLSILQQIQIEENKLQTLIDTPLVMNRHEYKKLLARANAFEALDKTVDRETRFSYDAVIFIIAKMANRLLINREILASKRGTDEGLKTRKEFLLPLAGLIKDTRDQETSNAYLLRTYGRSRPSKFMHNNLFRAYEKLFRKDIAGKKKGQTLRGILGKWSGQDKENELIEQVILLQESPFVVSGTMYPCLVKMLDKIPTYGQEMTSDRQHFKDFKEYFPEVYAEARGVLSSKLAGLDEKGSASIMDLYEAGFFLDPEDVLQVFPVNAHILKAIYQQDDYPAAPVLQDIASIKRTMSNNGIAVLQEAPAYELGGKSQDNFIRSIYTTYNRGGNILNIVTYKQDRQQLNEAIDNIEKSIRYAVGFNWAVDLLADAFGREWLHELKYDLTEMDQQTSKLNHALYTAVNTISMDLPQAKEKLQKIKRFLRPFRVECMGVASARAEEVQQEITQQVQKGEYVPVYLGNYIEYITMDRDKKDIEEWQ